MNVYTCPECGRTSGWSEDTRLAALWELDHQSACELLVEPDPYLDMTARADIYDIQWEGDYRLDPLMNAATAASYGADYPIHQTGYEAEADAAYERLRELVRAAAKAAGHA